LILLRLLLSPLLYLFALYAVPVWALDSLSIELDGIDSNRWASGPVSLRIEPRGHKTVGFTLEARKLRLPAPLENLRRIELRCPVGRWRRGHVRCPKAVLIQHLDRHRHKAALMTFSLDYVLKTGVVHITGQSLAIANGRLNLDLTLGRNRWRGKIGAEKIRLVQLLKFLSALHSGPLLVGMEASAGVANLVVDFDLSMLQDQLQGRVAAKLRLRGVNFSDNQGLHAGEGVGLDFALQASGQAQGWTFQAQSSLAAGTVYLDPVLLDVDAAGLEVRAKGRWNPGATLDVSHFDISQPNVAKASGSVKWLLKTALQLEELKLRLPPTAAFPLYDLYLKPFTGAGALSDLSIEGRVEMDLNWQRQGDAMINARLDKLAVGDAGGLFALLGLDAELNWRSGGTGPPSRMDWKGAQLYRLDLGAGNMQLTLQDRTLQLNNPLRVNLLSGSVEIAQLQARDLGRDTLAVEMAAKLDDIDLGALANTLAWVPMAGQLSGRIPAVQYKNGHIQITGGIDLSLFDGSARITNLSLDDPFGLVPRLGADIDLHNLSLDLLSQSFSFGAIKGRLDGQIHNLVLDGWQPVSFDVSVHTPAGDTSKHRISQRAVDNLASLGGANAVLSSTFLRFFNEFSYQRLGLSCRLRAGVCEMGGIAPAEQGYYIVQGGGIPPRVDVVGYNQRVDWQILLGRLRAINQLDEVVVQ